MTSLRERAERIDPFIADVALALVLTALVVGPLRATVLHGGALAGLRPGVARQVPILAYVLAAATTLPLAFRRQAPGLVLIIVSIATAAYMSGPFPPSTISFGPMIAMYTVATRSERRRAAVYAMFAVGTTVGILVSTFSEARWVAEVVMLVALVIAAALYGDATRNRRDYVSAVEMRAIEAERTREEEALRRVNEERVRIAREVHDTVAHSLSIVAVQSGAALTVFETDPDQVRTSLQGISATSRDALKGLRSMIDVLRTGPEDAQLTPVPDLRRLDDLVESVRDAGFAVASNLMGDIDELPAVISTSAYRIVQEALTNAVRHSNADRIDVTISVGDSCRIHVADNGQGPVADTVERGGHGLVGMRERVAALGGEFSSGEGEDGGFQITASIPMGMA
jgi:signal transduction histidine kinase